MAGEKKKKLRHKLSKAVGILAVAVGLALVAIWISQSNVQSKEGMRKIANRLSAMEAKDDRLALGVSHLEDNGRVGSSANEANRLRLSALETKVDRLALGVSHLEDKGEVGSSANEANRLRLSALEAKIDRLALGVSNLEDKGKVGSSANEANRLRISALEAKGSSANEANRLRLSALGAKIDRLALAVSHSQVKSPPCTLSNTSSSGMHLNMGSAKVPARNTLPEPNPMLSPLAMDFACKATVVSSNVASAGRFANCVFDLHNTCSVVEYEGCFFFGDRQREAFYEGEFLGGEKVLPSPVAGEIGLTENQVRILEEPFVPCEHRPKHNLIGGLDLRQKDPEVAPVPILAGGMPLLAQTQQVNFVGWEMRSDHYHLGEFLHKPPPKLIVDIGANIGFFSIHACRTFPNVRVLSFEPSVANFRFLHHNVERAGCADRVVIRNAGLSNVSGMKKICWKQSFGTTGFLCPPKHEMPMATITPQQLVSLIGKEKEKHGLLASTSIDILKIDCEGCEYFVLDEIKRLIGQQISSLVCEIHSPEVVGRKGDEAEFVRLKKLCNYTTE